MSIQPRPNGTRSVFVYDPAVKRKVYVKPADFGKATPTNDRQAKELERLAVTAFRREASGKPREGLLTVREYATEWLEDHHGEGTRRPASITRKQNEQKLRVFLDDFGDRQMDGGIIRREALRWAKSHEYKARTVAAMFNDAFDDEETKANPFANRRHKQSKGRTDIVPLTEMEVERLADIALKVHKDYGLMCRAWILFLAWVGTRPGEAFGLEWPALDFEEGLVTVTRIKGFKQTDRIIFPKRAQDALLELPGERVDRVFSTVYGKRIAKGSCAYSWNPVRAAFLADDKLAEDRRRELLSVKGALDPYALRHHCASQIVANGGDEYDVSFQLGNTPEVARQYVHDYAQRRLDRIRHALDGASVASLDAARKRRGA